MPAYNTFDLVLLALLAIGLARGVWRGLSGELAGLFSLIAAGAAGWYWYPPLGEYVGDTTSLTDLQADTVSFVVILICSLAVLWAVFAVLKLIMSFAFRGPLEKVGGGMVGLLRYGLILTAVLVLVAQWSSGPLRENLVDSSFLGERLVRLGMPWYEQLIERYPEIPSPESLGGLRLDQSDFVDTNPLAPEKE